MEEKPNYYAVIPANVRYDKNLRDKAKLLFGEISALSNKEGLCWASNSYFADLYDVSIKTISTLFKELEDNGYIKREYRLKEGTKEIETRYTKILVGGIEKNFQGYGKNLLEGYRKNFLGGIEENFQENNTSNNNTSMNNNTTNVVFAPSDDLSLDADGRTPIYKLPLIDKNHKKFHPIYQEDMDFYQTLYPSANVEQEFRNMVGWLDSNPSKRKTKNGIKAFITRWLSKEQNRTCKNERKDIWSD